MDVAERTLELLQRVQADLTEIKRGQVGMGVHLTSMERHVAASQKHLAELSTPVASIKDDIIHIKGRLNLGSRA